MTRKRVVHTPGKIMPDGRGRWDFVRNMSDAEAERRAKADRDGQPIGPDDLVVDTKPIRRLTRWKH